MIYTKEEVIPSFRCQAERFPSKKEKAAARIHLKLDVQRFLDNGGVIQRVGATKRIEKKMTFQELKDRAYLMAKERER